MTAATLFTGFDGAGIGLAAAGLDVRWGVEYDDEIASVARMNGHHVLTQDILTADPTTFEPVDFLHASPPCPNFSVAKAGGTETESDLDLARKVAGFITAIRPRYFTLENVWGYRKSKSWAIIRRCLHDQGYEWNYWHLNAADYGVPQTRKRMIAVAVRGGSRPKMPTPTHAENPINGGLFGHMTPRWIGWYKAIEDLLPTCPDSQLAPWQLKRLPDELRTMLIKNGDEWCPPTVGEGNSPTVSATNGYRAVLIEQNANDTSGADIYKGADAPAGSIRTGTNHTPIAFVVDGKLNDRSTSLSVRDGQEPFLSVTTSHNNADVKAAFMVDGTEQRTNGVQRCGDEPAHTVKAEVYRGIPRAFTGYRVVQLTPRCLARFQTFPDTYTLPESRRLACRGIGNAVPALLMQRVAESLLR